jgi:hypothetical protein
MAMGSGERGVHHDTFCPGHDFPGQQSLKSCGIFGVVRLRVRHRVLLSDEIQARTRGRAKHRPSLVDGKVGRFADAAFKALIIIAVGTIISWIGAIDARYWTASCLALFLVIGKTGDALAARRTETERALYLARQRMLIRGSVLWTMTVGVLCLMSWLTLARPILASWEPFTAHDYLSMVGLFLGVGFHLR